MEEIKYKTITDKPDILPCKHYLFIKYHNGSGRLCELTVERCPFEEVGFVRHPEKQFHCRNYEV